MCDSLFFPQDICLIMQWSQSNSDIMVLSLVSTVAINTWVHCISKHVELENCRVQGCQMCCCVGHTQLRLLNIVKMVSKHSVWHTDPLRFCLSSCTPAVLCVSSWPAASLCWTSHTRKHRTCTEQRVWRKCGQNSGIMMASTSRSVIHLW